MSGNIEVNGDAPSLEAAKGYQLQWKDGYRLERIASGYDDRFPRVDEMYLAADRIAERPVIVVGEEGAGGTSSVRCLAERAKSSGHLVEVVDLEMFEGETLREMTAKVFGAGLDKLEKPTHFLLVGLDSVERRAVATKFLAQLRKLYDGAPAQTRGFSIVIYARDERAIAIEPYSAIASVSDVCRLPRFNVAELAKLLAKHQQPPDAAGQLSRLAGGQPLLTQLLLMQMGKGKSMDVGQLMARVGNYPPHAVNSWRQRLARMIESDEELRAHVRDLVNGREYPIQSDDASQWAPQATRSLSFAGWMAPSVAEDLTTPVWRFSDLHRAWAAPVLRQPRRFLLEREGER